MQDFHKKFFEMEEQEELFSLQLPDGTYYWDIIRRDIFAVLHSSYKGTYSHSAPIRQNIIITVLKDIIKTGINELSLRYLNALKPDYIFITFQRHKVGEKIVDHISDHLCELVSDSSLCIEFSNKASINYLSILFGRKTRLPPFHYRERNEDIDSVKVNSVITNAANKHFSFSIDFYNIINYSIRLFKENRHYYRRCFSKFLPKTIICSDNGTLKGMYFAAQEAGLPVIELQHGAAPGSILWTYSDKNKAPLPGYILPTAFFTFSDYWSNQNKFPVKLVSSIGNDNFYQPEVIGGKDIVVISNMNTHAIWVDLVLSLADLVEDKIIYYKLHPQHYHLKENVVADFKDKSNVIVIDDEMNADEIFRCCDHVVGMRSTLIYAALQAGKNVYLYKRSNYDWDGDIIKYLSLFNNAFELNDLIRDSYRMKKPYKSVPPIFFQKFNPQRFIELLDDIGSY